jgi:hypothetical protein
MSYISDNEGFREQRRKERIPKREEKGFREQSLAEELVIGRVWRDSVVIVTAY